MEMRPRFRLRSIAFLLAVLGLVGASVSEARAQGTDANGFFTQYLVLGPYSNPAGAAPAAGVLNSDFLCDGETNEDNILPEDFLELGDSVLVAGDCNGSKAPALQTWFGGDASIVLGDVFPTVRSVALGDGLNGFIVDRIDFNSLYSGGNTGGAPDTVMAYAWVWVNNNTAADLDIILALASDDAVIVDVNRQTVFSVSVGRGYGGNGTIQDRFPVTLTPGPNLVQFKVFEGGGGWGLRARFETSDCPPGSKFPTTPLVDGAEISVGVEPLVSDLMEATRSITSTGTQPGEITASVTLNVENGGTAYNLRENFDAGWTLQSSNPPASSSGAGFVSWTNITASTVTYTLARSGEWEAALGDVSGAGTFAGGVISVGGTSNIPGGLVPYVPEVLVTASMALGIVGDPLQGCSVTAGEINGDWISGETGDGTPVTDATIVPEDGLELIPEWDGASQASGMTTLGINATNDFWTDPGDPFGGFFLNRATSDSTGLFDWQRADIYELDVDDTMNVAFFYVVNTSAQARDVVISTGSDDAVGVRVNGTTACAVPACRGDPGFLDKLAVTLDPGKNLVSVYTFENAGGFNMRIRFEDMRYQPILLPTTVDPTGYDPGDHAAGPCEQLSPPHVAEVLVTSSFQVNGFTGCTGITADIISQNWIAGETGGGATVTDATIIPEEGMVLIPDYLGIATQNESLDPDMQATLASDTWWEDPVDPNGGSLIRRVASNVSGLYDWQRADIYNGAIDNTMNVAWFYVISNNAQPICAPMSVGTDDAVGVRVNGRVVHTNSVCRGNPGYADKFSAQLDPGKNLVAIYTFEEGGGYNMRIRFETEEGTAVSLESMNLETTLDSSGYDPNDHELTDDCQGSPYVRSGQSFGLVTQFLVPAAVFDQDMTSNTIADALPEDYISQSGGPPDESTISEGAIVEAGAAAGGRITTAVRGNGCTSTQLVKFNGFLDGAGGGDPGLFDGESFYGAPDNYSSTLFFFVNNRSGGNLNAWFAFASDDAATLFLNGELVADHLTGRGFGGANVLQTFAAAPAVLSPGSNFVQLSYTEGGGGSGARVGIYRDSCFTEAFDSGELTVSANPTGFQETLVSARRILSPRSCEGTASVRVRFSLTSGDSQAVQLTENLPVGAVGSNPSQGSFNGAGSVLTFNGNATEGMEITYDISNVDPAASYCLASVNGSPVLGDSTFKDGCPIAFGNLSAFSGGVTEQLIVGPIALDPTANAANGLCDDNGNLPNLDYLIGELVGAKCATNRVGQETNESDYQPVLGDEIFLDTVSGGGLGIRQAVNPSINPRADEGILTVWLATADANGYINYNVAQNLGNPVDDYIIYSVSYIENLTDDTIIANLEVGSDDSVKVIVNGDVGGQFVNSICRGVPGVGAGDVVQAFLEPGINTILIGVVERGSGTGVRLLVLDEFNAPLTDGSVRWTRAPSPDADFCESTGGPAFKRGDADAVGPINITDGVFLLNFLFLGGTPPPCMDAADVDDGGSPNITTAVYLFNFLFLGGPEPPAPGPDSCESDPSNDTLGCASYDNC